MARAALCLALLLGGCAHGGGAGGESGAQEPGEEAPPAATASEAPPAEGIERYMDAHFVIATTARDWVIDGRLEALREPLLELASYDYPDTRLGAWLEGVARMQQAARLTAEAHTLDLAATGVAAMARACGECHAEMGGGPLFVLPPHPVAEAGDTSAFAARMARHMWAADRMWEGLTGPSDASWEAGARELAASPEQAPSEAPLPPPIATALADLRALGDRALEAGSLADRADVYGLLLASCSGCHAHLVPPAPTEPAPAE